VVDDGERDHQRREEIKNVLCVRAKKRDVSQSHRTTHRHSGSSWPIDSVNDCREGLVG
jgi:hypothetical protein